MKISDFVEVKNARLSGRYSKQKVCMGHFIEDYISEKVDINVSFEELLKHKDDIFDWSYVGHHYKFFFSRMIPEVLIHSKKQDERIIREHYDHKNDLFNWFLGPKMIYTSCFFKDIDETRIEVLRGESKKPLYITAKGIDLHKAAEFIQKMHGDFRIPTLLKLVDSLGRS